MKLWFIVGLLGLIELFVLARIRVALLDGAVPLNPAGWLGYSEYLDVTVERRNSPTTYWFILLLDGRAGAALRPVHLSGRDPRRAPSRRLFHRHRRPRRRAARPAQQQQERRGRRG